MSSLKSKALAYFPSTGDMKIVEMAVPAPEPDEILIRITRTAITRRDRLAISGREIVLPDGSDFIVPGHMAVGRVVEVGGLTKGLSPGDLVVPTIRRDCNRCIDARSDLCPHPERYRDSGLLGAHGFAREFVTLKSRYAVRVPEELADVAMLLPALSMAEKGHTEAVGIEKRFNFYCYHESERVSPPALVTGMGAVGTMTVFLLSLYSYRLTVFCRRDSDDLRSTIFKPLDLEYLNISHVPIERLAKAGYSFRQIFETTGDPDLILQVIPFMSSNAVMVLMGVPHTGAGEDPVPVAASRLFFRMVTGNQVLMGSVKAGRDAFESAVKHLTELADLYRESLLGILSCTLPFQDFRKAASLTTRDAILPILEIG